MAPKPWHQPLLCARWNNNGGWEARTAHLESACKHRERRAQEHKVIKTRVSAPVMHQGVPISLDKCDTKLWIELGHVPCDWETILSVEVVGIRLNQGAIMWRIPWQTSAYTWRWALPQDGEFHWLCIPLPESAVALRMGSGTCPWRVAGRIWPDFRTAGEGVWLVKRGMTSQPQQNLGWLRPLTAGTVCWLSE